MSKKPEFADPGPSKTWATECRRRSPRFKRQTLGQAKQAVSYRWPKDWYYTASLGADPSKVAAYLELRLRNHGVDVYEEVDGEWVYHPELSVSPETHRIAQPVEYDSYGQKRWKYTLERKI